MFTVMLPCNQCWDAETTPFGNDIAQLSQVVLLVRFDSIII